MLSWNDGELDATQIMYIIIKIMEWPQPIIYQTVNKYMRTNVAII
jgi:hypothetical protein